MDLRTWAKRLRHAADVIDQLFELPGDGKAARRVLAALPGPVSGVLRVQTKKGYSYHGKHWTQTPAGRKVIAARSRAVWAAKKKGKG